MPKKLTTAEWIAKAKAAHGDRYDYSKVEYTKGKDKVAIICRDHGVFTQRAAHHVSGVGCQRCYGNHTPTTSEWIEKVKAEQGDRYDYSKVEYIDAHNKVIIICREHGEFKQTPSSHNGGRGCPKCVGMRRTTSEWIVIARGVHGDKYDYSLVKYRKATSKIIIRCPEHGEFEQQASDHLHGYGCYKCYGLSTIHLATGNGKIRISHYNKDKSSESYFNNREVSRQARLDIAGLKGATKIANSSDITLPIEMKPQVMEIINHHLELEREQESNDEQFEW